MKRAVLDAAKAANAKWSAQGHKVKDNDGAKAQVTALSLHSREISLGLKKARQCCDLRERAGRKPQARHVLTDRGERREKYEIETGIMRDGTIGKPLEPWTAPGSYLDSMYLYGRIMNAEPGAYRLSDFEGQQVDVIRWMRDQELASIGEDGEILPLSDAERAKNRMYPGAPMPDDKVRSRFSRYLGGKAQGLVLAAISNLCAGRSVRRSRKVKKRETLMADGVALTTAEICAEANRIRTKRADLAEYRYLSLSRCREIITGRRGTPGLIEDGTLDELAPPMPTRRGRTWVTIPRVIRRFVDDTIDRFGRPVGAGLELAA